MIEAKYHYRYSAMWSWQSCGELHIDRNYELFANLANVRNYDNRETPIAEPRFEKITLETHDEVCSAAFARWVVDYGVDGHSHSYVTLDELETANTELAARCRLIVTAHGLSTEDARLVFFFDN